MKIGVIEAKRIPCIAKHHSLNDARREEEDEKTLLLTSIEIWEHKTELAACIIVHKLSGLSFWRVAHLPKQCELLNDDFIWLLFPVVVAAVVVVAVVMMMV